jgi:hypothetical protein
MLHAIKWNHSAAVAASACLLVQAAAAAGDVPSRSLPGVSPVRSCESLRDLSLPHTTVREAILVGGDSDQSTWCRILAVVSYPSGDNFTVWIGLPLDNWNGRFQGQGGGGFLAGSVSSLAAQVAKGYAVAATDAGIQRRPAPDGKPSTADGSFALNADGRLNWDLIRDFAHRGMHEMTIAGKAATQAFYGRSAARAYFNGCSTGGRQGQMEAQRYPDDYDGILSGAPAVNWTKLHVAQLWGHLQMLEAKHVVAPCKLTAATAAAVAACDAADGVKDGIIGLPRQCAYDPKTLVGASVNECGVFSADDARIVSRIWEGPRTEGGSFLWYGLQRGADLAPLNDSDASGNGVPFAVTLDWWRYFLREDPHWDWHSLSGASYEQTWNQSVEQYPIIATDNADLSAFRKRGGKTILWHGEADQLIYPQGTIDYFERIQRLAGGAKSTDGFMRLFMAPGVAHCAGGAGPQPVGQLEALVRWVEQGTAPAWLLAESRDKQGKLLRSRPLCAYPNIARYLGHGSTDEAENFVCTAPPKS